MNTSRSLRRCALAAIALSLLATPIRAAIDLDHDSVGDIWRLKYGVTGAPDADTDGDGQTNAQESGAGTDPNSPSDAIAVTDMNVSGTTLTLTWPSVVGKRYKIQSTTTIANAASWTDLSPAYLEGTGADMSDAVTISGPGTFYRIAVYDKDTDGDGVTDWEELALGLDPENDHSHGLSGPADLAWVTGALTTPSVVTITAPANEVPENSLYPATFTVTRTGGIKPITVNYATSGGATPGTDYAALSGSVTIPLAQTSATIPVMPVLDATVESPEAVIVTLSPNAAYTVGQPGAAGILITDLTSATGTGVLAEYWNKTSANINDALFPTTAPLLSRIEAQINGNWPTATNGGSPGPGINADNFVSRWTGEILPQYSQIYTIFMNVNAGGRIWVGDTAAATPQLTNWGATSVSGETSFTIALQGGRRYAIRLEHMERTNDAFAIVSWQSASQAKQVIPQSRLFPNTAPQITSPLEYNLFVGGPAFSYQITASANPTSFGVANLPPGLSVNAAGLITGGPTQAGEWQTVLSATNAVGTGSAILKFTVLQAGGGVVREQWDAIPGTSVASIPTGLPPTSTSTLTTLQGPTDVGESYGARIRGYITAPKTGTYTFWLSADHAAQLRISDDEEPVNAWLRTELTAPSSAAPDWSTAAKTEMLQLVSGRRYYFEVLHKEDAGADNLAIGWAKPGEATTGPSEIVPGYVLTQYTPATPIDGASTLYATTMSAQGLSVTGGFGSGTIVLSADKTALKLYFNYGNLTTPVVAKHLHSDADGGLIFFDIDAATPDADGGYSWNITPVNGIADKDGDGDSDAADIVKIIENGNCYINVHTANYPAGEIRGNFRLAAGSQSFSPPANPPSFPDDHTDYAAAARFLTQATFGGSPADIAEVQALGYEGWIDAQFAKPVTLMYPYVFENRARTDTEGTLYSSDLMFNAWWKNAVTAKDQLRQRAAFALSEILVTSNANGSPLDDHAEATSDYYDTLLVGFLDPADPNNQVNPVVSPVLRTIAGIPGYGGSSTLNSGVFGNFRDILLSVTLHPAMGRYLDMVRNDKPNISTGQIPNENYAREIKQLFSLGLNRLHPDGTLVLDSKGLPIPTYDQDAISGFAQVFTGWDWNYTGAVSTANSFGAATNYLEPMREVPRRHFVGPKRLLNNVVIPGLSTAGGLPLDPYGSHTSAQYNDPAYLALPAAELVTSHEKLFNHPNVGPFICRQLIQRMVTSTPSHGYIYRVVQKFNDNGSGVRGDMKAVIKQILLDYEARSETARAAQGYGKQREPIVRVANIARAFPPQTNLTGTWQQDGGGIIVNTTTPHRLSTSQVITLTFGDTNPASGTPLALSGTYTNSTLGSTFTMTATSFAVRAKDVQRSTYAMTGTSVATITLNSAATFAVGAKAYVRFRDGALAGTSTLFDITEVTSSTVFKVDTGTVATTTGTCDVSYMTGSYSMAQPAVGVTSGTATIQTNSEHGLTTGANVHLDFKIDTNTYAPVDGTFAVTVLDKYRFTVTADYPVAAPAGTGTLSNQVIVSPESPVLNRGGHVAGYQILGGYGDFTVGGTDTDLGQTPMASPTVFNFYLPDYQYPGEISSAGLYTPEFQITSDTTTVAQSNFLYNGIFNPATYTTGFSSFKSGNADIPMDFSPWMEIRPGFTTPWTDNNPASTGNDNLRNYIREMSKLLMAGQMSAAMENQIYDYVTFRANPVTAPNTYTNSAYTNGATTTLATANATQLGQRRDRVRAVVHLIVTSPEFTIQK